MTPIWFRCRRCLTRFPARLTRGQLAFLKAGGCAYCEPCGHAIAREA